MRGFSIHVLVVYFSGTAAEVVSDVFPTAKNILTLQLSVFN
jgi:hypothetical protein